MDEADVLMLQTLTGVWVKSDYIEELGKTKSPIKASKKLRNIVTLIVDPQNVTGDTLTVGISINNHEGGNFLALFSEGQTPNSLRTDIEDYETRTNFFDLAYEINKMDTSALLLRYSDQGLLIDKVEFTRVCRSQEPNVGADFGIQLIVNKLLFEGDYKFTDSLKQNRIAKFNADGRIQGFEGQTRYTVQTDFVTEVEDYGDVICFDKGCYSFVFTNNVLQLFQMSVDDEHNLVLGKMKYGLLKQ